MVKGHFAGIGASDSPQMVNEILADKWNVSLYKFAQVFAVSPMEMILQRNDYPFSGKEIKEIKHIIGKMQANLLKEGRRIRRITKVIWDLPEEKVSDEQLIKEMHLEEFIEKYIHRFEVATRYVEKVSFQGGRGAGLNTKSIIALGWGNLVSDGHRRIDWRLLGQLYEWFWNRVGSFKRYAELKPVDGLEEYLRHQYNAHRWAGSALDYVCEKLEASEAEILTFIMNLFLQRLVGGKEDYFRDRLPLSDAKFKCLFMNLIVDAYLTKVEGLTLFAKDQPLADPYFAFFDIWLAKNSGKIGLPNLLEQDLPIGFRIGEAEDPYVNTQIDEYRALAFKLYLEQKSDITELPPLIVFPDKTIFVGHS